MTHSIFDPISYTTHQEDFFIAGIPFGCIYSEASNFKILVDSGRYFSWVVDLESFESAQSSFLKMQTESLRTNLSAIQLLESRFGVKVGNNEKLEADPSRFHDFDDLRQEKFVSVEKVGENFFYFH